MGAQQLPGRHLKAHARVAVHKPAERVRARCSSEFGALGRLFLDGDVCLEISSEATLGQWRWEDLFHSQRYSQCCTVSILFTFRSYCRMQVTSVESTSKPERHSAECMSSWCPVVYKSLGYLGACLFCRARALSPQSK